MKKLIPITILIVLFLISCSKEPDVKLFSPEAFAYTLDNGWELNATVQASGFAQVEKENSDFYYTHLNYTVNLFTPEDSLFDVDHDSVIDSTEEELMDIQIETQIELDSGFTAGNYTVEFIVEDAYSSTKDTISTKVTLE
ncbi:MAG: hypothetical protein GXO85_16270 [Chlorobi bacterium]|nr:hypothetical protein [Chlorobiota bacterium]